MKKSLLTVMLTGLFALVSLPALGNINLEQLKQKTEGGETKAQLKLGYRHLQGNETTEDLTQAMDWFRRTAEREYTPVEYVLGLRYINGEGVSQDYARAVIWYKKAALEGLPQTRQNLGVMYHEGDGMKVGKAESVK